jgi:hypothetical protein
LKSRLPAASPPKSAEKFRTLGLFTDFRRESRYDSAVDDFSQGCSVPDLDRSQSLVPSLDAWLSCANALRSADVIFVLAGEENRKRYGLEFFRQGLAPRILFSVGRFEIRRFSKMSLPIPLDLLKMANDVPPPQRHFLVLFERSRVQVTYVRPRQFGTLTEIEALSRWLDGNPEIHSLLIVSGRTHLRRLNLCCRSLLSTNIKFALIAAPCSSQVKEEQSSALKTTSAVFIELLKVLLYLPLLRFRRYLLPSRGGSQFANV